MNEKPESIMDWNVLSVSNTSLIPTNDVEETNLPFEREWQPIETIPDEGEFLVWSPGDGWNVIFADVWIDRPNGDREFFNSNVYVGASHWCELTQPLLD